MTDLVASPMDTLDETIRNAHPGSFADRIRRRQRELQGDQLLDIDVPGYEDERVPLVLQVARLDPDELADATVKLNEARSEAASSESGGAALHACALVLVKQVRNVTGRTRARDAEYVPLDEDDHERMTLPRLAEFFGFEYETSREVLYQLLGESPLEARSAAKTSKRTPLLGMFNALVTASSGMGLRAREAIKGESRATPL